MRDANSHATGLKDDAVKPKITASGYADSRLSQDGLPSKFCLSPVCERLGLTAVHPRSGDYYSYSRAFVRRLLECARLKCRLPSLLALPVLFLATSSTVFAYRPFDSTDAAVAGPGDFELELGPLGLFFDAARKRVYVICGEGRVDMFQQESADRYSLIESSKTWPGARTGLFVAGTSRLYVAAPASATSSARILVYEIH